MKNSYKILGSTTEIYVIRKSGEIITVLVDTEDIENISANFNTVYVKPLRGNFYARGALNKWYEYLHRFVMHAPKGSVVDHINCNTLDNRKHNLRIISNAENQQNRSGATRANPSGKRGVSWNTKGSCWRARVCTNGKEIYLGMFVSLEEAHLAVSLKRQQIFPYSEMDRAA